MIKRFNMKYESLRRLFDLGIAVAVGDKDTLRFLDLQTKEMGQFEVKAGGESITCMNLSMGQIDQNNDMVLLVGGAFSNKMDKISIPEAIAGYGKNILKMQNEMKNVENFKRKMIHLKKNNKLLREENHRLKVMLKKKEKGKTDPIAKYEKKIMKFCNEVKTQVAINARLEEDLKKIKNQLTTLKFKKTRRNAVNRNLLIYQVLKNYRQKEIETKSDASSCDSDQSKIQNHLQIKEKVTNLNRTIRNQRDLIHELNQQIFIHQNREDDHQTLREMFDRLDRYLKRMTKKNRKVKEKW